jgi:hypothetical protein
MIALIKITTKVDLIIIFFLSENADKREMNITAAPPINRPVNGILNACKIPPNAASLNPHKAVIRSITEFDSIFP